VDSSPPQAHVLQDYAIKTWRYLRLAMIGLVIALAAAVVYEVARRGADCVQTSISAYYYTPARAIFVGALIAIGACLICLRGSRDWEDILLNVAGMLAPVVALVPTPEPGACAWPPGAPADPTPNVENNITAVLVVGIVAFVALAVLSWRHEERRPARLGYVAAVALWAIALLVFVVERKAFVDHGHLVSAVVMFGCIIAVAFINAISFKQKQGDPNAGNRYSFVGLAMLTVLPLYLFGGKYHVLLAEIDALVLFAIFWIIQTQELWDPGIRAEPAPAVKPLGTRSDGVV
jgi:hypothetical protein